MDEAKTHVVFDGRYRKLLPRGYRKRGGFVLSTDNVHEVMSFLEQPKFAALKEALDTLGAEFHLGPDRALARRISSANRLANRGVKLVHPGKTNKLFISPPTSGNEITTAMIATAKLIAINIAVSLAMTAVMSWLMPKTQAGTDTRKSVLYENGVNTNQEGVVLPYIAGRRVLCGGNIIEGSVRTSNSGLTGEFVPGPAAIAAGATSGIAATGQFEPGSALDLIRQAVLGSKGKGKPMENNTHSNSHMNVLVALGVGEIGGIIGETDQEKRQNIFIDEVPLATPDGDREGVVIETRNGVAGQSPILITPGVSNTFDDPVELPKLDGSDQQFYKSFVVSSPEATLVDVRLNYVLKSQDSKGGEHAELIEIGFDTMRENDEQWHHYGTYRHKAKTSSPVEASVSIKAPPHDTTEKWLVRVYRITPDSTLDRVQNTTAFQGWTETIERELPYDGSNGEPPTALLGVSISTNEFGKGTYPSIAALCMGVKVPVPDVYDVETRTSSGEWFGDWKYEATDNPVWHFRHLATGGRGVGAGIPEWMFDKFHLYRIAQWCDEKVGGRFRHSLNKQFVDETDTWEFLTELAKSFGCVPMWLGSEIRLIADMPRPVSAHINNDSAEGGNFDVQSIPIAAQVNEIEVEYDNPDDFFRKAVVRYRDEASIARNKANGMLNDGRVTNTVYKVGCTDPREALAYGMSLVYKAQTEFESIAWTTNLSACTLYPGMIVEITDWTSNGEQATGRVKAVSGSQITLDNAITFDGGTSYEIHAQGPNGIVVKPIAMFGSTITTDKISVLGHGLPAGSPITIVKVGGGAVPKTYEIQTREQTDTGQYQLTAIEHYLGRYAYLDSNQPIVVPPWTSVGTSVPTPTGLKARSWGQQDDVLGASFNIEVSWDAVRGKPVRGYRLEALFPGEGTWRVIHDGPETVFNLRGALPGTYIFVLRAVSIIGSTSQPTKPLEFLLGPNGEGDLLPPVFVGLDDVTNGEIPFNHFTGKDLRIRFREDLLNIGAYAYQVDFVLAGGAVHTTYVKQSDPEGTVTVGTEEARMFSAVLPYEVNASMGLTRDPIIRLRTQGADGRWSGQWLQIEAHNPVPVISSTPQVTAQLASVAVQIKKPNDPDVSGYLMAISTVEDFDPELNVFFDSTSNAFTVEMPNALTHWAKFAAYDAFGKFGIQWTAAQPIAAHTADFDEWQDKIDAMEDVADAIREGGYAKAADVEDLAVTNMKTQAAAQKEISERYVATYLKDKPIGSVVESEIERTDDLVETVDLIAIKKEDRSAVVLNVERVEVDEEGTTFAEKMTFLETKTDTSLATALAEIETMATDLRSEASLKYALITTVEANKAQAQEQFDALTDETTALASYQLTLGALTPDGNAILVNTDKLLVNETTSMAQRDDYVMAQFNGDADEESKSWLLNSVNVTTTKANAAADVLTFLGANLGDVSASKITSDKVQVGPSESLAESLVSLKAELDNKSTSASVTSQINTAIGPGSTLAQSITTAQSTANGAQSSANIAINAINGNDAGIAMFTRVGNSLTGVKINGATSLITMVAGSIGFVSTAGGTPVMPLQVVGDWVIATKFRADDVTAGRITANHISANNLTQTTQFINNGSVTLSASEQSMVSGSLYVEGRVDVNCVFNFSQSSGSPAGAIVRIYRDGVLLDELGTICDGAWGSNGINGMVTDYPGNGSHTYSAYAYTSGGSSGNPTKTRARLIVAQKKSET